MPDFKTHMKRKFPSIDIDEAINIFDKNINEIKAGAEQAEANPEVRLPLGCDLNKNMFLKSMFEYLELKQTETKEVK